MYNFGDLGGFFIKLLWIAGISILTSIGFAIWLICIYFF